MSNTVLHKKFRDEIKEGWQVSESAVQNFRETLPNILALVNEKFQLETPDTENQVILQNLDFILDAHHYFGETLLAVYQFQLWDNLIDEAVWYMQSIRSRGLDEGYATQMLRTWVIALHSYVKNPEVNELARPLQWLSSHVPDLFQAEVKEEVLPHQATELLNLLLNNDRDKAEELVHLFDAENHSDAAVINQLFLPVLSEIGRLWCANRISVADEHLAVANLRAIYRLFFQARSAKKKREQQITICCVPGEEHEIGAELLSLYLDSNGWEVVFIGHSTPEGEILRRVRQKTPFAVILSITLISHLPALKSLVQKLRASYPALKILAGGRALMRAEKVVEGLVDGVPDSVEECYKMLEDIE